MLKDDRADCEVMLGKKFKCISILQAHEDYQCLDNVHDSESQVASNM